MLCWREHSKRADREPDVELHSAPPPKAGQRVMTFIHCVRWVNVCAQENIESPFTRRCIDNGLPRYKIHIWTYYLHYANNHACLNDGDSVCKKSSRLTCGP
jgi:hypothetical protein